MKNRKTFMKMEDIKRPVVLFFAAVYISALVIELWKDPLNAMILIGLSFGIFLLSWLIIDITKKSKHQILRL